jgi:hypothetical protein
VLLGRAPISRCLAAGAVGGTVNCENRVEGADGLYGGATAADSSGSLRYVQVRYPGFEVTPGNELNGITLAGVGTGTSIEYVQVHNSSDDAIEWFGGTVNQRYLVLTGADDDTIDTDFGFRGAIQFVLATQRTLATASNQIIEADTAGNDPLRPRSRPNVANMTALARNNSGGADSNALLFRGGTDYNLINSVVDGLKACVELRNPETIRAADATQDDTGPINIRSTFLQCTGGAALGSAGITTTEVTNLLSEAGRNNVLNGTGGLVDGFFPAAPVLAVTPVAASTVNSYFTNTSYIGAFASATDTWFAGWTCSSAAAFFAPAGVPACTTPPLPIQP